MVGPTSKLDQVAEDCVLRFQISPRAKVPPTSLFEPFPALDHPNHEGFSSLHPNKFLRISLSVLVCIASHPFAVHFQEATGSIFPVTIHE